VKQIAITGWKNLVQNTPRTVRELLPILMKRLINNLSSPNREKQATASRCIGELVGKLEERVLPELMPIFFQNLSPQSSELTREGVCVGLKEVVVNCSRQVITDYVTELIPAIRQAICDESPKVRAGASQVVTLLHRQVGAGATTPIVAGMFNGLKSKDLRCLLALEELPSEKLKEPMLGKVYQGIIDSCDLDSGSASPEAKSAADLLIKKWPSSDAAKMAELQKASTRA